MLQETHSVDSVFIHDSIFIREGGDTVVITRWRTSWRERTVHDTVRERVTDTIVKTVERTVESTAPAGSREADRLAWAAVLLLAAALLFYILAETLLKRN